MNQKIKIAVLFVLAIVAAIPMANAQDRMFAGKTMVVIGDSYVRNHRRPVEETWHARVAARLGMNYRNYGRNGNCIAFDRTNRGFGKSILDRYHEMTDTADYVLVIAGHNDAYMVLNSRDSLALFRTRLGSLCTGLRAKYPQAAIGFVTPWAVERPGFAEVTNALREICAKHGFPILDAVNTSGIKPMDADFRHRYFQADKDEAHLNADGHGLLLDWGEQFLRTMSDRWSATNAYIFTYFDTKKQDAGLCIAYSYDGYTWTAINDNRPVMRPMVGRDRLLRDPSICLSPDGTFHLVWTVGWSGQSIGYASSRDLVHWSEQRELPVMKDFPTARNTWAPELFRDETSGTYYIFWASTVPGDKKVRTEGCLSEDDYNHRIYCTKTRDFRKFTKTRLWFNPEFNAIDAAVVRNPQTGELIMAVKNENLHPAEKNIRITRSSSMKKGFPSKVSAPINSRRGTDGKLLWCEGPAPLFVGNDLVVYYDMYGAHRFGASISHDNGLSWEDCTDKILMPQGMSHGTAISVPRHVVDALVENNRR